MYFVNPFRYVQASDMAEIGDKMTRNEIMTSNEIRQVFGLRPSTDPKADELRNKNLNRSDQDISLDQDSNNGGNLDNAAAKELTDLKKTE